VGQARYILFCGDGWQSTMVYPEHDSSAGLSESRKVEDLRFLGNGARDLRYGI